MLARAHPVDPDLGAPDGIRCPQAWYPDWRLREPERTERLVDAPAAGVRSAVEHDGFWWRAWGPRPTDQRGRVAAAAERLAAAPRLVPLFHRLYVAAPDDSPVFQIDRVDVRIPAWRLTDLPIGDGEDATAAADRPVGGVAFWSELHAWARSGPGEPFNDRASAL